MELCPILAGRDRELAALVDRLRQEDGAAIFLAGEAGLGKSRLLREFARMAGVEGWEVLWGRPEVIGSSAPYSLIADLLEGLRATKGSDSSDLGALAEEVSAPHQDGSVPSSRRIAAELRGILSRIDRRVAVLLEDLQLADEMSVAVTAHLMRSAADDGLLLIASYRPEESRSLARLLDVATRDRLATTIELASLERGEVAEVIEALWSRVPSPRELESIAGLAEGVPFFVEELASAWNGAASVPDSVTRSVRGRLESVDPGHLRILQAASVMAGAIDIEILSRVVGVAEEEIPPALLSGLRFGLLADSQGRLTFRHALLREAVQETVPSFQLSELHRRVADSLAATRRNVQAAELALHLERSGQDERAAPYWRSAAHQSLAVGALDEAELRGRRAVALARDDAEVGEGLVLVGEVLVAMRRFDEASAAFAAAIRKFEAVRLWSRAHHAHLRSAFIALIAVREEAIDSYRAAIAAAIEAGDDLGRLRAQVALGYALARVFERPDEARPMLDEVLPHAQGDSCLLAETHEGLAWVSEWSRDVQSARAHGEQACQLAVASDNPELIGRTHANQALRLALHGNLEPAVTLLESARNKLGSVGTNLWLSSLDQMMAWVLWRMGKPGEAERYAVRAELASGAPVFYARMIRAWCLVEAGEVESARMMLLASWEELGGPSHRSEMLARPGELSNAGAEALILFGEAILAAYDEEPSGEDGLLVLHANARACENATPEIALHSVLLHARGHIRRGEIDEGRALVAIAREQLADVDFSLREAEVLELEGELLVHDTAYLKAAQHFADAVKVLERVPNVSDRVRCLGSLARATQLAGGSPEELKGVLRSSLDEATACRAQREARRLEAIMRGAGLRPRAGRPKGGARPRGELSSREEEVVSLVAVGATNAEISRRLFLAERTVEDHVRSAQRRLGLSGRASLAAWAARSGLI